MANAKIEVFNFRNKKSHVEKFFSFQYFVDFSTDLLSKRRPKRRGKRLKKGGKRLKKSGNSINKMLLKQPPTLFDRMKYVITSFMLSSLSLATPPSSETNLMKLPMAYQASAKKHN